MRGLGRAHRRARLIDAATLALICVAVGLAGALVLSHLGWARGGVGLLLLSLVVALGAATRTAWRLFWALADPDLAPAALAERLAPELGTAATAAVELARRLSDPTAPFSRPLAEAHLERTAQLLGGLDLEARLSRHDRT
ncbi:MAG TPA: hypothetical protein VFH51_18170, partial [Myxococcota bacterium]|nr:hypothetical protein [Myxococcota bacterium]